MMENKEDCGCNKNLWLYAGLILAAGVAAGHVLKTKKVSLKVVKGTK